MWVRRSAARATAGVGSPPDGRRTARRRVPAARKVPGMASGSAPAAGIRREGTTPPATIRRPGARCRDVLPVTRPAFRVRLSPVIVLLRTLVAGFGRPVASAPGGTPQPGRLPAGLRPDPGKQATVGRRWRRHAYSGPAQVMRQPGRCGVPAVLRVRTCTRTAARMFIRPRQPIPR